VLHVTVLLENVHNTPSPSGIENQAFCAGAMFLKRFSHAADAVSGARSKRMSLFVAPRSALSTGHV